MDSIDEAVEETRKALEVVKTNIEKLKELVTPKEPILKRVRKILPKPIRRGIKRRLKS